MFVHNRPRPIDLACLCALVCACECVLCDTIAIAYALACVLACWRDTSEWSRADAAASPAACLSATRLYVESVTVTRCLLSHASLSCQIASMLADMHCRCRTAFHATDEGDQIVLCNATPATAYYQPMHTHARTHRHILAASIAGIAHPHIRRVQKTL